MKLNHGRKGERERGRKIHDEIIIQTFQMLLKTLIYRQEAKQIPNKDKDITSSHINQTVESQRQRKKLGSSKK